MMGTLRVLIADDDLLTRMILERSVAQWGHRFISAADGSAAQEVLRNESVDVCILDWDMPGMTGVEVCKWIKSTGTNKDAHIIMNTTKGRPEEIQEAFDAGANDHIKKPTDLKYLRTQLNKLADKPSDLKRDEQFRQNLDELMPGSLPLLENN